MANPFVLTCLGYPELLGPDGRVIRIRVKKHLALLVYLAVERQRRSHDRARLAELFWPRSSSARGRHSCATALSLLRTIFGRSAFSSTRNGIRFGPANLSLDLDRLAAGEIVGSDGEAIIDVDGFLRGFDIDDAPEFSLWKEREHARRLPAIHAGLLTLIDHGRRRGSHDEIMQRAERLLAVDHLAEEGIRAKMEALALVGDRFSALRVFDEWKEQLARELMAEPSMTVQGMASQLRKRGWEPKEPNPVPAVPAEQWRDRRFVGRKHEYRRLYETWEAVHQHHPRHFLIAGDSGVGKTTLAQRLVTAAGLEGASVSRVQCYQLEQRIPFAAIGGLVTGLLGRPGVAATAPEALSEVARIVPQVKLHFPTLPPPKPSEGESARLLFAEGVIDLLGAVMDERPLLLVMDDVHYADEASMAVLHLVMRRIAVGRCLMVLSGHPEFQLPSLVGDATPRHLWPTFVRLDLPPMSDEESHELLEVILQDSSQKPSSTISRALVRGARGFPLILELITQDWISNGPECLAIALNAVTPDLQLPPNRPHDQCQVLVERLLSGLSPSAMAMVSFAALAGHRLNDTGIFDLIDLSLRQTLEALSELVTRRILRDVGAGLEFMNELVRAHFYRVTPAPVRIRLHGAIADRLLGSQIDGDIDGLEIAWHVARAHRRDQVAGHLLSGSRSALLRGAPDEVVLGIQSSMPLLQGADRTAAEELLVEALYEVSRWSEGLAVAAEHEDAIDGARFRILAIEGRWQVGLLDPQEQRRAVGQLLDIGRDPTALGLRALTTATFIAGGLRDEQLLTTIEASASPTHTLTPTLRAAQLTIRAGSAFYARQLARGEQDAIEARNILRSLKAANAQVASLEIGLSVFRIAAGDYSEALAHLEVAIQLGRRLGNFAIVNRAATNAALSCLRLGNYEQAISFARDVRPELDTALTSVAVFSEALSLALLDRQKDAINRLASAAELDIRLRHSWARQHWYLLQADVFWCCGRRVRALELAALATSDEMAKPLARGTTGRFFRWALRPEVQKKRLDLSPELVQEAVLQRGQLDALDRFELLTTLMANPSIRVEECSKSLAHERTELGTILPQDTVRLIETLTTGL